jgi:hypothetical protein
MLLVVEVLFAEYYSIEEENEKRKTSISNLFLSFVE